MWKGETIPSYITRNQTPDFGTFPQIPIFMTDFHYPCISEEVLYDETTECSIF